jgi:hypothetical protein
MPTTVDQNVGLETVGRFMIVKIYLDDLVRFLREAFILSGSEEPSERGAIVIF